MKMIYVAGPYRSDLGENEVRENIRRAEDAAKMIWLLGAAALCPHKNTAGFGGAYGLQDMTWLDGDIEMLLRCDAIYALPGSESSRGAMAELTAAKGNKIPILTSFAEVKDFIDREGAFWYTWELLSSRLRSMADASKPE